MNSMFSSFDALCAEFLGQKVKASFPTQQQQKSTGAVVKNKASVSDNLNNREEASLPQQAQPVKKQQSQKAPPRFALELDGLNCFETLVYR
ncbi:hypothetical protein PRUPE_5G133100 [Prunus persica]|uniref:Uncharacterized protein n=1 Tax=Prunus persica TaxID=3760 RepID=M5WF57_PRUPE|nr:hypothetical protein PRUPE_5G133100 [Prunus persica]